MPFWILVLPSTALFTGIPKSAPNLDSLSSTQQSRCAMGFSVEHRLHKSIVDFPNGLAVRTNGTILGVSKFTTQFRTHVSGDLDLGVLVGIWMCTTHVSGDVHWWLTDLDFDPWPFGNLRFATCHRLGAAGWRRPEAAGRSFGTESDVIEQTPISLLCFFSFLKKKALHEGDPGFSSFQVALLSKCTERRDPEACFYCT